MSQGGLPSGTVTFLFTDVEGSTRLWVADEASMAASVRTHDEVIRSVVAANDGHVFSTAGDSFAVAFDDATLAVECAVALQNALGTVSWPGPVLRVRIGLHRGVSDERDGDYFGSAVSTAARVEAAAHGGQIVISDRVEAALDRAGSADDPAAQLVDLGVHRLRDVDEPVGLFQVGDTEFPPLRVVPPQLIRLPAPATGLVGQDATVRSIRAALSERRLVTLTGVGGAGKTRVALEVADREIPHFVDGVVFVDLASVTDSDDVPTATLAAAGVSVGPDETATEAIERWVSDRTVLLVVDNCEHVIDGAAELVESVIAARTDSRVLATSREMLDVDGEQVVQVPSLDTEPNGSAVQLFVERARAVGAAVDGDDPVVAHVCQRLDGMPLAIELAAARTATMTPRELSDRLDDRFSLLTRSGRRGRGQSRQRTLAATIDWSHALLTEREQLLFRACSVFDDSFDIEAACAVADLDHVEGSDLVASLVTKSLIVARHTDTGSRYRLLETLRSYAEQKLIDHDETLIVRRRLIDHVAYIYIAPDDRVAHEFRWGSTIEANHGTVATAVALAEDLDLPAQTRVRLLTASLLRQPFVWTASEFRSRASVQMPEGADPTSPATRFALGVIGARGRMYRGDLEGALECFRALERAPEPWPWWGVSNRLRIEHRHDPATFVREVPAAAAPRQAGVSDRARITFHVQSAPSVGGLDRDLGLAHVDELLSNPLVVHVIDRQRFTSFRYAIEGAWAGPGQQDEIDIPISRWRVKEIFLPYRDPGAATTRLLAERYRTLRRDPVNFPEAAASLVLLATAAEAREQSDLVRRALLAVRWPPTWMLPVEVCGPVIARRHGFLDELVERDLTEAEANGLGQVFLDLATEFDPAVAVPL